MKPLKRLELSEAVIAGWEQMGRPGGSVRDNMRMIGEELAELRKVLALDPSLQKRVDAVGERYGRMALKIKLTLN